VFGMMITLLLAGIAMVVSRIEGINAHTTLALSSLSQRIVLIVSLAYATVAFIVYLKGSIPHHDRYDWSILRRTSIAKWVSQGCAFVLIPTMAVSFATWYWMQIATQHWPGSIVQNDVLFLRSFQSSARGSTCRTYLVVQVSTSQSAEFCGAMKWERQGSDLVNTLKSGDNLRIGLRTNVLGTSVATVSIAQVEVVGTGP
jgi:hypothetical protein